MVHIKKLALIWAFLGLWLLMPVSAGADMVNNLTNEACITCHQNYPAIKQGSIYTPKHKWDVCDNCHTNNNASASLETSVNLSQNGKVSFWYRVSSEMNYDKFYFYLDGVEKLGGISGNVGWYQVTFPLTAGAHTMRWTYVKDEAVKWFDDCVSIDDIVVSLGGNALDCNTCHMNSHSVIQNAINGHNTDCSACHGIVDHEEVHNSYLDHSCLGSSCHNPYLSTDHKQKNIDCTICHNSTSPVVLRAVGEQDKNCGSCHSSGHNVSFSPPVPNIPLFEGYQWSAVTPLSVWKGEDWIPVEVGEEGYIIVSNRRTDVNSDLVWNFYQARMTELGWTLQSPEPLPGTSEFKVTCAKAGKTCVIWFHGLEDHSRSLPDETGFKLEIIYN